MVKCSAEAYEVLSTMNNPELLELREECFFLFLVQQTALLERFKKCQKMI